MLELASGISFYSSLKYVHNFNVCVSALIEQKPGVCTYLDVVFMFDMFL